MKLDPTMRIGIIGGRGRTGRQFATLFRNQGFPVMVTDVSTKKKNRDLIEQCDVVIFAVPLQESVRIMQQNIGYATRKDQLIMDVSSLKEGQVKAMLEGSGEVLGMHPMFGPKTDPKSQTVILCPGRVSRATLQSVRQRLRSMGLKTVTLTPRQHDRLMAFVQALPHLKSLLIAGALHALHADLDRVEGVSPPPYEIELDLVGRFLDDDPALYGPIMFGNAHSPEIIATLQKLLTEFAEIGATQDYSRFGRYYRTLQRRFGPRLARARARSEACIHTLTFLSRS